VCTLNKLYGTLIGVSFEKVVIYSGDESGCRCVWFMDLGKGGQGEAQAPLTPASAEVLSGNLKEPDKGARLNLQRSLKAGVAANSDGGKG
jgi:hypothetical protein